MKQLLIESNKVKLTGYKFISNAVAADIILSLYPEGGRVCDSLLKKMDKNTDSGMVNIQKMNDSLVNNSRNLVNSAKSEYLRGIYKRAVLSDTYKECVFILFILGIVNTDDLLRTLKDVNFIVQRITVLKGRNISGGVINKRFEVNPTMYADLMAEFFKLSMDGVQFPGVNPLDFIYHMLAGRKSVYQQDIYQRVLKTITDLNIKDFSKLKLTQETMKKYYEEVGVLLPSLSGHTSNSNILKILDCVVQQALDKEDFLFVSVLIKNKEIIKSQELIRIGGN